MTTKKPKYVPGQTIHRNEPTGSVWDDFSSDVYDDDMYNHDGTLKQGSLFDDSYDYESTYARGGAASSWWRGKFSTSYDYKPSYLDADNQMAMLNHRLSKELKEISRTVNAVRNTLGAKNREKNLKVAWSGTQFGRSYRKSANNSTNHPTIYLSPDPLTDKDRIKPDWTEDQKRDALIGEALTLTSMKRTVQPVNVKKIQEVAVDDEVIRDLPLMERSDQEKAKLRTIAREMWKSLETYKAQGELLQDYRGCRPYFAAYLAFYSDKGYKEKLEEELNGDQMNSIKAAAVLAWNLNHMNVPAEQLLPPEGDVEDVMLEAFEIIMDAVNYRSTFQRWEASVQAAEVLRQLDKDDEEDIDPEKKGEEIGDDLMEFLMEPSNGNTNNLFGGEIENQSGATGKEEVEQDESMDLQDAEKAFSDCSTYTEFIEITKEYLLAADRSRGHYYMHADLNPRRYLSFEENKLVDDKVLPIPDKDCREWDVVIPWVLAHYREKNKRMLRILKDQLEPNAKSMVLPEYGMRSGRVTGNSLWKVPTNLPDSDRVFHRKVSQGDSKEVTLAMLIDFSGSMSGASLQTTKRIALLLHDLLLSFPQVRLELYGHEVCHQNTVMKFASIEELFAKPAGGGTNEGTALARTGLEFLRSSFRKDRKLLLVIGDGCSGFAEIEKAVTIMSRTGIELYDILIDGDMKTATQLYGRGKVVGIYSYLEGYGTSQEMTDMLKSAGYTNETPQEVILEAQFLSILRPWLTKVLQQLHDMGSI